MPQQPPSHWRSLTPTPRSSSRGRSLSRDMLRSRNVSPVGQMTNHGKRRQERSPSEWRYKRHREQSPGDWMVHPLLPLVRHEKGCAYCNEYAMHFASGAAASGHGFREAIDGLIDRATAFIGRKSSSDLAARVNRLRNQHDELTGEKKSLICPGGVTSPILHQFTRKLVNSKELVFLLWGCPWR